MNITRQAIVSQSTRADDDSGLVVLQAPSLVRTAIIAHFKPDEFLPQVGDVVTITLNWEES